MARPAPSSFLISHVNLARGFRGGERQTELLIRELAQRGWRQRLIARQSEPLIVRLADLASLERVAINGIVSATGAVRGSALAHAHEGRGIQALAISHLFNKTPYLVTRRVLRPLKRNPLTRLMYRRAACLVGLSRAIATELRSYVPSQNIEVIADARLPEPVRPDRVRALRREFGNAPVIGHVGALSVKDKGQTLLIDIARARPQYTFVLVGGGNDEAMLRQQAAGLGNVLFTGQVDDVNNHLAAFDVFAFPSRSEGLGSTLLDAMAQELPIVASDVGGIPDIIHHERNGLLAAPTDFDAWCSAIDMLVDDSTTVERFALENRKLIGNYSIERITDAYEAVYRNILQTR